MTTGKNANKAANRRAVIDAALAPIRRQVRALEAEVEKLDMKNLEQQGAHVAETQKMRALIVANTSEALEATRDELAQSKALLETTETARAVLAEAFMRLADALQDAYEAEGMKPVDAHERKMRVAKVFPSYITDEIPGFVKVDDLNATVGFRTPYSQNFAGTKDPDKIARLHRLQRAKGLRS